METFLDIIPSELVNIIFSYIDDVDTAINLVEISSFDKLFNNTNFWKSLIKEKIDYLIEALDIGEGLYKNIITYYKCINTYESIINKVNRSIRLVLNGSINSFSTYTMKNIIFNKIDLFIYLIEDVNYKKYICNKILYSVDNTYELTISKEDNKIIYSLYILTADGRREDDVNMPILILNKEQYLKILFYGHYNGFI